MFGRCSLRSGRQQSKAALRLTRASFGLALPQPFHRLRQGSGRGPSALPASTRSAAPHGSSPCPRGRCLHSAKASFRQPPRVQPQPLFCSPAGSLGHARPLPSRVATPGRPRSHSQTARAFGLPAKALWLADRPKAPPHRPRGHSAPFNPRSLIMPKAGRAKTSRTCQSPLWA